MMTALWPLVAHHWRRYRLPLLPMMAGLAVFEFLLTRMAPAPDEVNFLTTLMAAAPPELLALIGDDLAPGSPRGFVAIGYGHPFFFILMSAWVVRVASGALAGEIGRGTMDLLASRPVARWQHVAAGFVTVAAGLVCLAMAAWSGTSVGLHFRHLGVRPHEVLPVVLNAWTLFLAWGAVGLLVSSTARDGGTAMGWLSGLIAGSFVLEYIARLWKPAASLRPWSPFAYHTPQHVIRDGTNVHDLAVLIGVIIVAAIAAVAINQRRDF